MFVFFFDSAGVNRTVVWMPNFFFTHFYLIDLVASRNYLFKVIISSWSRWRLRRWSVMIKIVSFLWIFLEFLSQAKIWNQNINYKKIKKTIFQHFFSSLFTVQVIKIKIKTWQRYYVKTFEKLVFVVSQRFSCLNFKTKIMQPKKWWN